MMSGKLLLVRESFSNDHEEPIEYSISHSYVSRRKARSKIISVVSSLKEIFLPIGYPNSVSSDYTNYQLWDAAQAFCSSITGALAGQSVLRSFGVGNESASVLAATMIWLLRDGVGMIGRILFTWSRGSALDYDCKRYRLLADLLNDFGLFLQFISPSIANPNSAAVTLTLCCASVLMSIVGVCGGATRAALTQHQARQHNMADVSAKDSSQETVINLFALIINLILLPSLSGILSVPTFIIFTILHLVANWLAVKSVVMETFNPSRLQIAIESFISSNCYRCCSVEYANANEPLLFTKCAKVKLGCSINDVTAFVTANNLFQSFNQSNKIIINCNDKSIFVLLNKCVNDFDILCAMVQCELLQLCRTQPKYAKILMNTNSNDLQNDNCVALTNILANKFINSFLKAASNEGWVVDRGAFNIQQFRFDIVENQ